MEPIAILEGGTKAFELLKAAIDLLSNVHSRKRTIFTKYIKPAFSELRPIIRQYVINIAEYRQVISSCKSYDDLDKAYRSFVKNRVSVVLERQERIGTLLAAVYNLTESFKVHPGRRDRAKPFLAFLLQLRDFFFSQTCGTS